MRNETLLGSGKQFVGSLAKLLFASQCFLMWTFFAKTDAKRAFTRPAFCFKWNRKFLFASQYLETMFLGNSFETLVCLPVVFWFSNIFLSGSIELFCFDFYNAARRCFVPRLRRIVYLNSGTSCISTQAHSVPRLRRIEIPRSETHDMSFGLNIIEHLVARRKTLISTCRIP